ncbi:pectate lyase superfamily protein-domain-containing protein [Microdochium bolleyi]|uniref:Pectate lyase superfamily protein-domain-containing protein n=1 Tax=Microdochium bolleyi TaxID=196109 RepID=A0A136J5W1_9PEZI|nr:pectate lyase superfamily protein-domain-containing protein [Microdochium bolleyi]
MENIEHTGTFPFGGSGNAGYKVFRNVKDYGATGDGKTDDTAAINRAMSEANRCGANCGSSSVKGAILYIPSGTYLISTPIEAYYNTQMIGDVNALPVLLAAPSFVGLGVLSSDKYTGGKDGADEWFINQNNFMRQMRNFAIDTTQANMKDIAGMHWQVAQATSIQNVFFFGSKDGGKERIGAFAENGSGGFMSDLTFFGSAVGMRCGNQQFTTRNLRFIDNLVAIDMLWDWGWTWKSLDITGAGIGMKVTGEFMGGSIMVLDSRFDNVGEAISVKSPRGSTNTQHFSITMDNVRFATVRTGVSDATTGAKLDGGSRTVDSWTMGRVYEKANPSGTYQAGAPLSTVRPRSENLMGGANNGYLERTKPRVCGHRGLDAPAQHCVLYQYQLSNAENVFMGMYQTESPYYLPNPQAPAPFNWAVGKFPDDPTFNDCDASNTHCRASWGLRTVSTRNVHVLGAGLYNWFQAYIQACVDEQDCQQRVVEFVNSPGVWLYDLFTIGTVEMISGMNSPVAAKDNTNMNSHPFTSTINVWLLDSYDSLVDDSFVLPECTGDYSSVADVAAAKANIDKYCIDKYLVVAQAKMIDGALQKYGQTISGGYDAKFKIYADHIKRLVPGQLVSYMAKAQSSGFWSCAKKEVVLCCSDCHNPCGSCAGCSAGAGCVSGERLKPVPCPTAIPSGVYTNDPDVAEIHYTLTNEDGFYADLMKTYGIERKWVKLDEHMVYLHPGCQWGWTKPPTSAEMQQCIHDRSKYWTGFPVPGFVMNVASAWV